MSQSKQLSISLDDLELNKIQLEKEYNEYSWYFDFADQQPSTFGHNQSSDSDEKVLFRNTYKYTIRALSLHDALNQARDNSSEDKSIPLKISGDVDYFVLNFKHSEYPHHDDSYYPEDQLFGILYYLNVNNNKKITKEIPKDINLSWFFENTKPQIKLSNNIISWGLPLDY